MKTLTGPAGVKLVLDVTEVFPDDPGNGTPALVRLGDATATYDCALDTGEVDDGRRGMRALSRAQLKWLAAQQDAVDEVWREGTELARGRR